MRLSSLLAMLCAAFAAGAINSIAGGGTLLTFPVLIWLGLDPRVANGTSTVPLWPGLFGGLFGYRKELENSSTILIRLGATSVIGGAFGALLLIRTPSSPNGSMRLPNAVRPETEFPTATCKNLQLFRNSSPLSNGQAG